MSISPLPLPLPEFYLASVAPSGESLRGMRPPDRIVGSTCRRLFLAAYPLG